MPTLQEQETPIDQEVVNELVELTPEWWRAAVLEVTFSDEGGVERYAHVISSPEGYKEPIDPSEALTDATYRLGELFREHGRRWKSARYEARLQECGTWKYTVDFSY